MSKKRLTIMISSSVYGIEELLDRIYSILTSYGYEVWMSHKGTLPVFSTRDAFQNCIEGVRRCDLFLGLITPYYGTGKENSDGLSITHKEQQEAIRLNKPRWFLAHDHVVFARTFLSKLLDENGKPLSEDLKIKKNAVMDDLKVIKMYDEAIRDELPLDQRAGNWVQKYQNPETAMLFASSQFFRYKEVEVFIEENLKNTNAIAQRVKKGAQEDES
jgi:hypothetical protein